MCKSFRGIEQKGLLAPPNQVFGSGATCAKIFEGWFLSLATRHSSPRHRLSRRFPTLSIMELKRNIKRMSDQSPLKHGVVAVLQDELGRYLLIKRGLQLPRAP